MSCLILASLAPVFAPEVSHASSTPSTASRQPARCAQKLGSDHIARNPWAQARAHLAPMGADAIRLCRYSGLNDPRRGGLVRSRLLSDPALVAKLVRQLNELPPFPPGALACPSDDGSRILALLDYPNGNRDTVAFELTGCQDVTNGDLVRIASGNGPHPRLGPHLLTELERLTR